VGPLTHGFFYFIGARRINLIQNYKSMNIVLIGYRCSGKTAVGQILANQLRMDFVDTDTLIEEYAGCSIETMISRSGWRHFRDIEKKLIKAVTAINKQVIATGGGAVMDADNVKSLKGNAWVVWLNGTPGVLAQRMVKDQARGKARPSLTGADAVQEIAEVLADRRFYYERAGNFKIDTSTLSIREVVNLIVRNLPEQAPG
jgi:shikimate kinase